MRTFLFGLILMTGCATAQYPRVTIYPNIQPDLQVITADPVTVDEMCRLDSEGNRVPPGQHKHDDGTVITETEFLGGCYARRDNTIWISNTRPLLIYHELAHAAGLPREVADKIYFDRGQ